MSTDPLNARIVSRENLTADLAIVRVAPEAGPLPAFEPGQFTMVGLPIDPPAAAAESPGKPGRVRMIRRAYSIASTPADRDYLEFFLVRVPTGRLTPRLLEMNAGDRLWLDPLIQGEFTLATIPPGKNLVMVGTGTGISPYVSMLRAFKGRNRWRRFVLIHGVRQAEDLGYRAELEALAKQDDAFVYLPTVTREPADSPWRGLRGRVQAAIEPHTCERLAGFCLNPADTEVFLCGNPDMITSMETQLHARCFVTQMPDKPGNLHFERYW